MDGIISAATASREVVAAIPVRDASWSIGAASGYLLTAQRAVGDVQTGPLTAAEQVLRGAVLPAVRERLAAAAAQFALDMEESTNPHVVRARRHLANMVGEDGSGGSVGALLVGANALCEKLAAMRAACMAVENLAVEAGALAVQLIDHTNPDSLARQLQVDYHGFGESVGAYVAVLRGENSPAPGR